MTTVDSNHSRSCENPATACSTADSLGKTKTVFVFSFGVADTTQAISQGFLSSPSDQILPQRSEEVATNQKNRIRCLLRTFPLRSFQSKILPQRSEEVATNQKNQIRCLLRTFPLRSFQSKVGLKKKKNASSSDLTSFLKGETVLFGKTRGRTSKKTEEIYGLIGPMSLLNYACEAPLVIDEYGWSVRFRRNGQIDEEEEITVDHGGDVNKWPWS
ncbi:hypothetical protein PROFUN_17018, partial [Planoprotostelium fungivorum]